MTQHIKDTILIEIIQIIPNILWILLAFIVFIFSYRLLKKYIIPNMKSISAYGIEIQLLRTTINSIIEIADKHEEWKVSISEKEKTNIINRVQKHFYLFQNISILWFDDNPNTFMNEVKMFHQLGIKIDIVVSLEEALKQLKVNKYNLIISDIKREQSTMNGINTLNKIIESGYNIPTIFYIGSYSIEKGTPPHAFGITNRPDELLHLTIDILDRNQ